MHIDDEHAFAAAEAGMTRADPVPAEAAARGAVKAYLRIDHEDEDALIDGLVTAAIGHGERFTGFAWLERDARETLPASPEWRRLGLTPVTAITVVEALPVTGAGAALGIDGYAIDIDAAGDGWVRTTRAPAARVRVRYSAGLAEGWAGLPEALRQGAVRLASHLYTHRDAADEGAPPAAVAALWRPWRRMRLV